MIEKIIINRNISKLSGLASVCKILLVTSVIVFYVKTNASEFRGVDVSAQVDHKLNAQEHEHIFTKFEFETEFLFRSPTLKKYLIGPVTVLFIQSNNEQSDFDHASANGLISKYAARTSYNYYWGKDKSRAIVISAQDYLQDVQHNVLAHELLHIAHYQQKPNSMWHENSQNWFVQEGIALLGEYLSTNVVPYQVYHSYDDYSQSLVNRPGSESSVQGQDATYGHIFLYFSFLYTHCGGEQFFHYLISSPSPLNGTTYLQHILTAVAQKSKVESFCKSVDESFAQFQIARFTQDQAVAHMRVSPHRHQYLPAANAPAALSPFSAAVYVEKNEGCKSTDIQLSEKRCLAIRFE